MRRTVGRERRSYFAGVPKTKGKLRCTTAGAFHFANGSCARLDIVRSYDDDDEATLMADNSTGISDVLTNEAVPRTSATITVRIVKNFEYRTEKNLVLRLLNLETTTVGALKVLARQIILSDAKWKPYRTVQLGMFVPVACRCGVILSVV